MRAKRRCTAPYPPPTPPCLLPCPSPPLPSCYRPPQASSSGEAPVNSVHLHPQNADQILVCTRSPSLYLTTLQGQVRSSPVLCGSSAGCSGWVSV